MGQSDPNSEVAAITGLISNTYTVSEMFLDYPRMVLFARWRHCRGNNEAGFDCDSSGDIIMIIRDMFL